MAKQILNEEFQRMQRLAGINEIRVNKPFKLNDFVKKGLEGWEKPNNPYWKGITQITSDPKLFKSITNEIREYIKNSEDSDSLIELVAGDMIEYGVMEAFFPTFVKNLEANGFDITTLPDTEEEAFELLKYSGDIAENVGDLWMTYAYDNF